MFPFNQRKTCCQTNFDSLVIESIAIINNYKIDRFSVGEMTVGVWIASRAVRCFRPPPADDATFPVAMEDASMVCSGAHSQMALLVAIRFKCGIAFLLFV